MNAVKAWLKEEGVDQLARVSLYTEALTMDAIIEIEAEMQKYLAAKALFGTNIISIKNVPRKVSHFSC